MAIGRDLAADGRGEPSSLDDHLAALRRHPGATALLFDFDGTLAPIVAVPADAVPATGVVDLLEALATRYHRVAVVSGRPVAFLAAHLPPSVELSGLYGLESSVDGVTRIRPGADPWRQAVDEVTRRAGAARIDGLFVEPKGLSVTLHYRSRPGVGPEVATLASGLAEATGLVARQAKMSVELHPPVAADKGLVVAELGGDASAVLYVGDDLGDLPAFAALAELRAGGTTTLGVAVETDEVPAAIVAAADLVVTGPAGVIDLLERLAR